MPKMTTKPAAKSRVSFVDTEGDDPTETTEAASEAQAEELAAEHPLDASIPVEPEAKPAPQPKPAAKRSTRKAPAKTGAKSATSSASSLFANFDELEDHLRVLYWGREGSGKTSDALTMANRGKVILINAEGGAKKVALRKRGINTENILVWPKPGTPITYEGIEDLYFTIKAELEDDPKAYEGVVFDSATDVVVGMVDAVSDDRVTKARSRGAVIDVFDSFFVDRSDYGTMAKMFRRVARRFRDLPCHVVFTALERRDVDEDTSSVSYGPSVPPAVQTDLLGYVDIVINTKAADEDRDYFRGATKKASTFRAKDRLDMLPKVLVDPTMERILAYVNEDITEDDDPLQEVAKADAIRAAQKAEALRKRKEEAAAKRAEKMKGKKGAKPADDADDSEDEEAEGDAA